MFPLTIKTKQIDYTKSNESITRSYDITIICCHTALFDNLLSSSLIHRVAEYVYTKNYKDNSIIDKNIMT